jgi:hypothetical protein
MNDRAENGFHVASLAHGGRLWTAYLEFEDDPHDPRTYRARIRFEPAAPDDGRGAVRTAVLIIEPSYEEAMAKVRSFDERQLGGLLRSALPEEDEESSESAVSDGDAEPEAGDAPPSESAPPPA